jgi:hypothetical protein
MLQFELENKNIECSLKKMMVDFEIQDDQFQEFIRSCLSLPMIKLEELEETIFLHIILVFPVEWDREYEQLVCGGSDSRVFTTLGQPFF